MAQIQATQDLQGFQAPNDRNGGSATHPLPARPGADDPPPTENISTNVFPSPAPASQRQSGEACETVAEGRQTKNDLSLAVKSHNFPVDEGGNLQQQFSLTTPTPYKSFGFGNTNYIAALALEHTSSAANMSLSYESRAFMPDTQYPLQMAHDPQEQDEFKHDAFKHDEQNRYPSPPPPLSENPYSAQAIPSTSDERLEMPELPKDESDAPSPGRSKPVPKPDREITKDMNGRYYCTWVGCTEEVKDFGRKCEWSKHMDKHDRPYRCTEVGCEKLPGFTYSGGLLRHEREVHGKHGGPRKQLNCPHQNCKRHTGKGFSRQENLNEHLRRVHTSDVDPTEQLMISPVAEPLEDDGNVKAGQKRKRGSATGEVDLHEEVKRLKAENLELRLQSEAQRAQTEQMMRQIAELQNIASLQHPRMAPEAPM